MNESKVRLIGFTGRAGSGKTTLAKGLQDRLDDNYDDNYNKECKLLSFGSPIKSIAKKLLDDLNVEVPKDKQATLPKLDVSYRFLLQTLGTEWGRAYIHEAIWIKVLENTISNYENSYPERKFIFIIDDVRFENEANWIRANGGQVIHLKRHNPILNEDLSSHKSEAGLNIRLNDLVIFNINSPDEAIEEIVTKSFK